MKKFDSAITTSIIVGIIQLICIVILAVTFAMPAIGQSKKVPHSDAIMIVLQPSDLGIGVRYEHSFSGIGTYGSISYGNWGLYKQYELNHHIKYTLGLLVPLRDYMDWKYDFTAGVNYHYIHSYGNKSELLNNKIFNPWSFELGLSIKANKFTIAIRTDILRWEPCIDLGIPLNYNR